MKKVFFCNSLFLLIFCLVSCATAAKTDYESVRHNASDAFAELEGKEVEASKDEKSSIGSAKERGEAAFDPEYWSGQPFPSPGDLPNPGIEPRSPALQVDSLLAEPQRKSKNLSLLQQIFLTQESN